MTTNTVETYMVASDHYQPVNPLDGSAVVKVLSGDTVYYADQPYVTATTNQGSIALNASHTFTTPAWLRSASLSSVSVTVSGPTDDTGLDAAAVATAEAASDPVGSATAAQAAAIAAAEAASVLRDGTGMPVSVARIGSALAESGATGDALAVRSDGTLHRYKPEAINALTYGVVADCRVAVPFTSASGTTLSYASASSADVGKTVCIPGGGLDDGTGVKDGFTTTISSVVPGVSATLADSVPTTVNSGTNRACHIGTDNTTALQAFIDALGSTFGSGFVPGGDYLHTGTLDFATALATNRGLRFAGAGAGSIGGTSGNGATRFFYAGSVNSAVNGTGAPAMRAASTVGQYGLKQRGFSIHVLRALQVSTTVNGAGQTINTVGANLILTSAAGLPTGGGRITLAGAPNEVSYTGITGNTLTGAKMVAGTFTTAGGDAARLIVAAWFWDSTANQSEASDIVANGYSDNTGSIASANQGHGCWVNNPSGGFSTITRVHARAFNGPASEGWRFGSCFAGYGPRGNGGNVVMGACAVVFCHHGFHFNMFGGPCDGNTFNALKTVAATGGSTGTGFWIESGYSANTWNSPHAEGHLTGFLFDGAQGNTLNAPFSSYTSGTAGDGSTFVNFTNTAVGNIINAGVWQGYGTNGFDYGAQFASNCSGNRVTAQTLTGFPNPGTQVAKMAGTGNRYVDLRNPWDSPSTVVVTSTNASWPIPAGVQTLRISATGGGGGGGGGGSPGTGSPVTNQVGGSGGAAGLFTSQVVAVGANTTLNIQIGGGGNGGNASGVGSAGAGSAGSNGAVGGDTTVTGTGISVTAKKGGKGRGGAANNSTATTAVDDWGQSNAGNATNGPVTPGVGGIATTAQGQAGGDPLGPSSGGASGGMASTATLGGAGGNAGSLIAGGIAASTQTGTATGGDGANAAASQYGAPGAGGGGGAWNGGTPGAGGKGGNGQSGVVTIEMLG